MKNNFIMSTTLEECEPSSESKQILDTDSEPIDFAKNFKAALLAA